MAGLDDAGRAGVGTTRKDAPETNLENTSATGAQHDMYGREGGRDRRRDALQRRSYGARREASNINPEAPMCVCGTLGV